MENPTVAVINRSGQPLPALATAGASGYEVRAHLDAPRTIVPGERTLIPTGLYLQIPVGMEAQVRPRSGLAVKKGLTVLNAPGTIDADYRGELNVLLVNLGQQPVEIASGDRIAQLVFAHVAHLAWQETDHLDDTDRGSGGFGHTGISG